MATIWFKHFTYKGNERVTDKAGLKAWGVGLVIWIYIERKRVCVELVEFENRDFSTEKVILFCIYLAVCFLFK